MTATDSAERGREPIDAEFEPVGKESRKARARRGGDGIGFGAALVLALVSALVGAAAGAIAPRVPAVRTVLDRSFPENGAAESAAAPGQAAQFSALDQRVRAIEAFAAAPASAEGGGAQIIALQSSVRAVEAQLAQIPTAQQIQQLTARVEALQPQLEQVAEQSRTAGEAARAAFAVSAVADASRSSGPFEQSYRALQQLLPENENVRALAALARTGAPTRNELRERYVQAEPEIIRAARRAQAGAGFWGRIQAALAQWVTVRRRSASGDTADSVVERAGRRMAADDLAGAVQELSRLSGAPGQVAQPWLAQARRRLEIDTRLAAIREELSRRS